MLEVHRGNLLLGGSYKESLIGRLASSLEARLRNVLLGGSRKECLIERLKESRIGKLKDSLIRRRVYGISKWEAPGVSLNSYKEYLIGRRV